MSPGAGGGNCPAGRLQGLGVAPRIASPAGRSDEHPGRLARLPAAREVPLRAARYAVLQGGYCNPGCLAGPCQLAPVLRNAVGRDLHPGRLEVLDGASEVGRWSTPDTDVVWPRRSSSTAVMSYLQASTCKKQNLYAGMWPRWGRRWRCRASGAAGVRASWRRVCGRRVTSRLCTAPLSCTLICWPLQMQGNAACCTPRLI